jgi:hypothetical protein
VWLMFERGMKKASLKSSLHPLWNYFISWMLQFDYQRRPTFHQVLVNLKKVYSLMLANIENKVNMLA